VQAESAAQTAEGRQPFVGARSFGRRAPLTSSIYMVLSQTYIFSEFGGEGLFYKCPMPGNVEAIELFSNTLTVTRIKDSCVF
jgi:hypothetical protein